MVGLFGVTAGARLQNIVLYSERKMSSRLPPKVIAGTASVAWSLLLQEAIKQCRTNGELYGLRLQNLVSEANTAGRRFCFGGLAGASNMDLSKCTAVNDIVVSADL